MVQADPGRAPKALDQARRARVVKPPDQRRRDILEAATRLFGERGFDPTTVQVIATEAGVAAGTVYLYFSSKEAILVALLEQFEAGLLDRFAEIAERLLADETERGEDVGYEETVDRLIDGLVDYSIEQRGLSEVIARHVGRVAVVPDGPILAGALTDLLARVIREGVRLGYVRTSDPEMTAYLLNLAAVSAVGNAIASRDEALLERVVSGAKELFIKALAPGNGSAPKDLEPR